MNPFQSVSMKMYRARHHYEELIEELVKYYRIMSKPESGLSQEEVTIRTLRVPPQRFGLILGDCLQCLRSSLDYLVWELVKAGKSMDPGPKHQFPIANTAKAFGDHLRRGRLNGISSGAVSAIAAMQPFRQPFPDQYPLAVLESLSNINKHRRVLLTMLHAYTTEPPVIFPRMTGTVVEVDSKGMLVEIPVWGWISIQDGGADQLEIATLVDALARHLDEEVFPLFECYLD